ncbi:hypothetical protein GY45DRAFT_1432525 [Cubamyces sp. BRFM 1775]|nr:hypothetical protein GY45DRAFT_1432525 [Cubamyces sp. BRFM 1775]
MHNTKSQANGSSSARRRRQSDNTWNNSSPESVAHELARKVAKEENRSLNASTTTSASGSQRPHRGNPSRANETHPQQASTSSESPLTKSTATKRKRAADERSSALEGGERSSKKKRTSPQPTGDALESKRPRASSQSQESARNLPQVADSPMYDYTVPWVDSYWMFSDDSSATGAQAGWSSTRGRGDVNAFHDSSAFSPFTVDTLPYTSATPSEDSSTPLSSSSAYPAELLQVIDFTAYVAGPSTTRLPSSSPLQHTLPWNHAPPSFSSSVTFQAVHEPLSFPGSVPAPAIGSALSDAPSPWSAPSAAASGCRDAGNVAQPSRHAHTSPHALDRTSRVGPSGSRGPSLLQSQTDGAASSQSKKPPGKTSSRCNRRRGLLSLPWAPALRLRVQFSLRRERLWANHRLKGSPHRAQTLMIPHYKQELPSKGAEDDLRAIGSISRACRGEMSLPRYPALSRCVHRHPPLQRPGRTHKKTDLRDDYPSDEKHRGPP